MGRKNAQTHFRNFMHIKWQVFFSGFWPTRWNLMPGNQIFYEFLKKKLLWRCPKLIGIAEREASHSEIMFYRDAQALVIHIPRGTCTRGDIVIHIAFAHHISQRGLKQVVLILHIFKGVVSELYESPRNPAWRITSFLSVLLNATICFVGFIEKS